MRVDVGRINVEIEISPVIRCVVVLGGSVCCGIICEILRGNLNFKIAQISTLGAIADVVSAVKIISTRAVGSCRCFHRVSEEDAKYHDEGEDYEHRARKDSVSSCLSVHLNTS